MSNGRQKIELVNMNIGITNICKTKIKGVDRTLIEGRTFRCKL